MSVLHTTYVNKLPAVTGSFQAPECLLSHVVSLLTEVMDTSLLLKSMEMDSSLSNGSQATSKQLAGLCHSRFLNVTVQLKMDSSPLPLLLLFLFPCSISSSSACSSSDLYSTFRWTLNTLQGAIVMC